MIFEEKIKELSDLYFADIRAPDIVGFVDQLFDVAAQTGAVAGVFNGDNRLRFFVPGPDQSPTSYVMEHPTARSLSRMICACLGVIGKERSGTDISPYGDQAVIEYPIHNHHRWRIRFTNTPDHQEFVIEAL